jgi:regulator of protease activity HflC (stomatin/prohibitin superfamily)
VRGSAAAPAPEKDMPMLPSTLFTYAIPYVVVIIALFCAGKTVKILREYERAVVFTLGRFSGVKGPGLVILIPFIQQMVRVDLRIQVVEIPSQDVISHDNVSMKVDAVL